MDLFSIFLLVLALLLSAFFSGIEFAYININRLKVEINKNKGGLSNRILHNFYKNPSQFLSTTLMGNNIALVLFSTLFLSLFTPLIVGFFPGLADKELPILLLATLVSTVIVLIFGEFIPKNLFRLMPNRMLSICIIPFRLIYFILIIPVSITMVISKVFLKIIAGKNASVDEQVAFTALDLKDFVQEKASSANEEDEIDTEMFEKALDLAEIKAREVMVPRTEIEALDKNEDIGVLKQKFIETRHSRILIFDDTIDSVVGYAHHLDVLKNRKKIYTMQVIPEAMPAKEILQIFMKERKSIALVVDEFGGTAGIVSLEDVLEEIFGEIQDEHDDEGLMEEQISEHKFIFAGRLEIDYINEKYDLGLPEGDYETMAGMILSHHESIPEKQEKISIDHFDFKILNVSKTKIETVRLTIRQDTEAQ